MESLEDQDEKENVNLLRGYRSEDEEISEERFSERYVANEGRGRSREASHNLGQILPVQIKLWMESISDRVKKLSVDEIQQQASSVTSSGTRKRIQRQCIALLGAFLVFLKPSFTQLWTNDKPQKLHTTAYLDGLRGVAALFVVFNHYACQFTPALLEGWGTEHDNYWLFQFPVIRVTHNGALMVEIFFVLSGFVLSVKALKLARQGRQQDFVKSLVSSVFRRWLRLAVPVIATLLISLFIVRAEMWHALPGDWLSADPGQKAVTIVEAVIAAPVVVTTENSTAQAGSISVIIPPQDSKKNSTIQGEIAAVEVKNSTSTEETIAAIDENVGRAEKNLTAEETTNSNSTDKVPTQRIIWLSNPGWMAKKDPSIWNQFKGFVPGVAYILDPFNTNGIPVQGKWPSYDSGVLWTIPVEWSGSMITFVVVLCLAWVRPWMKLFLMITFACWGYYSGRGVLTQFVVGIILAELTIIRDTWEQASSEIPRFKEDSHTQSASCQIYRAVCQCLGRWRYLAATTFWSTIFLIGLLLGSFPHAKGEKTIGWTTITSVMKKNELDLNAQHLYFAASVMIVTSIIFCAALQGIFTTRIAQYLGRISFSIYLLHMHLLWTVGTRVFPVCMQIVGGGETSQIRFMIGMLMGAAVTFPIQFWVADVFTRAVDDKSIVFAKWVAGHLLDFGGD